jgi:hypothetical protein
MKAPLYRIALATACVSVLVGCAAYNMPHGLGEADCLGDCNNGVGTLSSKYIDLKYQGPWRKGEPSTGNYAITYKGIPFEAHYKNGMLVDGTKFYSHSNFELDHFTGKWQSYFDPFSQKTIIFPFRGIYYSITGAQLIGDFYAIPSRGMLKGHYEKNPDAALRMSSANLIFIGKLAYKGREEITTLASKGYFIGSPLMNGPYGSLKPSDAGILAQFKRELVSEKNSQQRARFRAEQNKMDFSSIIAIAATIAATSAGVSAGLTTDSAAYLGSGIYSLAADGDGSDLAEWEQHIQLEKKKELVTQQVQSNVNEIEQTYIPRTQSQPTTVFPSGQRNIKRQSVTVERQQPSASRSKGAERVSVDIEATGATDMYFPYEQSLDLAETKALNKAYALCRSDYSGRLLSDSGTLAKKDCKKHPTLEEYKCNAAVIFVCERR